MKIVYYTIKNGKVLDNSGIKKFKQIDKMINFYSDWYDTYLKQYKALENKKGAIYDECRNCSIEWMKLSKPQIKNLKTLKKVLKMKKIKLA